MEDWNYTKVALWLNRLGWNIDLDEDWLYSFKTEGMSMKELIELLWAYEDESKRILSGWVFEIHTAEYGGRVHYIISENAEKALTTLKEQIKDGRATIDSIKRIGRPIYEKQH